MSTKAVRAATLVLGTLVAGGAQAEALIVAHGFSPSHTNVKDGLDPWEACVTSATNGEITFENFPSAQISGHSDGTHSLAEGIAHITGIPPAYESEKFPLNLLIQLPGVGQSAVHVTNSYRKLLDSDGPMAQEWKGLGIQTLFAMLSAPYQLMTSGDPIDTMDKFKGQKIRSAGGPMTYAVEALGGTAVDMGTPDLYVGLQRGTVDGTILAMTSAPAYKLDEVLKSISTNGAFSSAHSVWVIDADTYQGLPAASQKAMMDCAMQVEEESAVALDEAAKTITADYAAKGITFYEFPPEMKTQMDAALATVAGKFIADLEARGLSAQAAYDEMIAATKDSM